MPKAATTKKKTEPQCIEAAVSSSVGGKVTLVKFDLSSDYHYSINRTYSIPSDWSEDQTNEWQKNKLIDLREQLESIAQAEADDLMEQSTVFNNGEYVGD